MPPAPLPGTSTSPVRCDNCRRPADRVHPIEVHYREQTPADRPAGRVREVHGWCYACTAALRRDATHRPMALSPARARQPQAAGRPALFRWSRTASVRRRRTARTA